MTVFPQYFVRYALSWCASYRYLTFTRIAIILNIAELMGAKTITSVRLCFLKAERPVIGISSYLGSLNSFNTLSDR